MIQGLRTVATFISIGTAAAVAYIFLSYFLTQTGLKPWIASVASYAVFVPIVYNAQKILTFQSNATHGESFPRYVITQAAALLLSAALPYLFFQIQIPVELSFIAVAVLATLVNFLLQNYWVFANNSSRQKEKQFQEH